MTNHRLIAVLVVLLSCFALQGAMLTVSRGTVQAAGVERPTRLGDILGVQHGNGKYYFTDNHFLAEGAEQILDMGSRVIQIIMDPNYRHLYPYNSRWPIVNSLVELAQTPYFKEVFDMPFTTYIIRAHEFPTIPRFEDGLSESEAELTRLQFYVLAKYLLETYQNTGKTFVLKNWEGDGILRNKLITVDESQWSVVFQGMIDWLNARQDGITRAREEVGAVGVQVVGAAEVNILRSETEPNPNWNYPLMIDEVVPHLHMDLYSYSSWTLKTPSTVGRWHEYIDYMIARTPPSELYGNKNIMIGEFGGHEMVISEYATYPGGRGEAVLAVVRQILEYAIDRGLVYAVYWQIYDNGLRDGITLAPGEKATMDQLGGVWLIRPDGSLTPTYNYFKEKLTEDPIVYTPEGETVYNPFLLPADQGAAAGPASGEALEFVDTLEDWSRVTSYTSGLRRRADNVPEHDVKVRIYRSAVEDEEIVYRFDRDIAGYNFKVFYNGAGDASEWYQVYLSADGVNWDPVASAVENVTERPDDETRTWPYWYWADLVPAEPIAEGYKYLKLRLLGLQPTHKNQVSVVLVYH